MLLSESKIKVNHNLAQPVRTQAMSSVYIVFLKNVL